jgi:hypothetical protein
MLTDRSFMHSLILVFFVCFKGLCKQKKDLLLQKCADERSKLLKTECSANDNFGSRNGVVKNGLLAHHSTAGNL